MREPFPGGLWGHSLFLFLCELRRLFCPLLSRDSCSSLLTVFLTQVQTLTEDLRGCSVDPGTLLSLQSCSPIFCATHSSHLGLPDLPCLLHSQDSWSVFPFPVAWSPHRLWLVTEPRGPWRSSGEDLTQSLPWTWVHSLVRELRSLELHWCPARALLPQTTGPRVLVSLLSRILVLHLSIG